MQSHPLFNRVCSVISSLAGQSNPVYVVGGYVRDTILGKTSADFDFVVNRAPGRIARLCASYFNAPLVTLDEQNRIYRVIHPQTRLFFDFAQMQGKTIVEDLARRDFTINAIACSIDHYHQRNFIDPYKGQEDIQKKIIRFISEKAIIDDPVRLLRLFRFSAELTYTIDPSSLKLLRRHAHRIKQSSGERIRDELNKILNTEKSGHILEQMDSVHLLTAIIPELELCRGVARTYYGSQGVFKHCIDSVKQMDFITTRLKDVFGKLSSYIKHYIEEHGGVSLFKLAALLHDIGKPKTAKKIKGRLRFFQHEEEGARLIKGITSRLKFSRREIGFLRIAALAHMRPGNLAHVDSITDRAVYRFFRDYKESSVGILLVSLADRFCYLTARQINLKKDRHFAAIITLLQKYFIKKEAYQPKKLINGHDVMKEFNIPESPLIGKLLNDIVEAQVEGLIKTKQEALSFIRLRKRPRVFTRG